ncbi:hypothetical protein I6A60_05470 [Frankia sp. AgB1.9]|uniref:hypothetical protein n=1 Tax=unclassified Frankia TaxID=2632575 RepID=UPI001932F934|nr:MULTISPECIES: hypothetical protein [unclassified Frankia]MBL7489624.1 hypothetical protein [Frankia sp. AgW1.1]MBL7547331.1 hypothetical protein [Frankia sp. AgB1.9]MBL7618730.1 hypothetical protein [Frankia sp. AgB1.8]
MTVRWRRRTFDAAGLTEYPAGPALSRLAGEQKVYVTTPGYDNIGEILTSMGVEFEPFRGEFDCNLLFVNCGTADRVDPRALAEYVRGGGCVYASDHEDALISEAFPGVFDFAGHHGSRCQLTADVLDPELRGIIGERITIEFDMGIWATMRDGRAEVLLRSPQGPIMVYAEHGEGSIFFTSFHNKAQLSDHEKQLLQLLVAKQFSTTTHQSLEQTSRALGLSLDAIRRGIAH